MVLQGFSRLRVLVCEFVTGGGMRGEPLPSSLTREGAMMRDALLRDLADLPGVELVATHDDRLAPPASAQSRPIGEADDVWAIWAALGADADVAWAIAPETGGLLSRLSRTLRSACATVVGPDEETIEIASSKSRTAERLAAHGIRTPQVWTEAPTDVAGPFVTKPDDGAGCEATLMLDRPPAVGALAAGHVIQPYVPGEAASLTVLRAHGETRLLAATRQHIRIEDGAFRFYGLSVGAIEDADGRLAALAEAVCDALCGLEGIFGIDIVLTPDGPVVIEINPRLTTAYAALREALGENPAAMVPPFSRGSLQTAHAVRQVEIAL